MTSPTSTEPEETTAVRSGQQVIVASRPSAGWLASYATIDHCSKQLPGGTGALVCSAPAVFVQRSSWGLYVPVVVVLALLLLFVGYYSRPNGPVRHRRRFRRFHAPLAQASADDPKSALSGSELRRLRRRLRRLERSLFPELAMTQHQWFVHHLTAGRHGIALESLARWCAESELPVPNEVRAEFSWLADSLSIEHLVLPVLDAHQRCEARAEVRTGARVYGLSEGVDIPLATFHELVTEAIDSLPAEFARAITNVAFTVEELANEDLAQGRLVYGRYVGVPLTMRYRWAATPDNIIIYRRAICSTCRSEEEVRAEVYRTVIHEIAHHFGIDDPRLRELGW